MGHATYLAIDLATIAVPLVFSYHPRIRFVRTWAAFWPACLLSALAFALWDAAFAHLGVWDFNERYVLGVSILGLPVEEILFFVCIPYACVFTYHVIGLLTRTDRWAKPTRIAVIVLLILCAGGLMFPARWYTFSTSALLGLILLLALRARPSWLGRALITYAVLTPFFFLVNGLLTGSWIEAPVVMYDDAKNMGVRLGTIPMEDIFYGLSLILVNIALFEHLRHRAQTHRNTDRQG